MKTIGIIAEYNPFHNGHAYQIKRAKELTGADYCVIVMSGDFVQRGAAAVTDKYCRTEMALQSGADLVCELPVLYSTASAELFAHAAVSLFHRMGCIDTLCFGAESDDLPALTQLADILTNEPASYQNSLQTYLKNGVSFPTARSKALAEYLGDDSLASLLSEPNNILAVEYLKALKRRKADISPLLIPRRHCRYHDTELTGNFSSATAIRSALFEKDLPEGLSESVPAECHRILTDLHQSHQLMDTEDFSGILAYKLLTEDAAVLAAYGDCGEELANRIHNLAGQYISFHQFCSLCKSRDITYTRISRILIHILLGLTQDLYTLGKELDYVPYVRILGFRESATPLFTRLKQTCEIPLITRVARDSAPLSDAASQIFSRDIFAAELYEQVLAMHGGRQRRSEYTRQPVQL
ncbi:MAG: nucleotidyltransferase [Roseburia sp.]